MCKEMKVSVSCFYCWPKHSVGARELKERELLVSINEVYRRSKCRYGIPRVSDELKEQGIQASRPRVARIMHKAGASSGRHTEEPNSTCSKSGCCTDLPEQLPVDGKAQLHQKLG
jgi:hypothetical protein